VVQATIKLSVLVICLGAALLQFLHFRPRRLRPTGPAPQRPGRPAPAVIPAPAASISVRVVPATPAPAPAPAEIAETRAPAPAARRVRPNDGFARFESSRTWARKVRR
jgi:hypothetical protein